MTFTENELKKKTLKSQTSQIAISLLNRCSISAVFPIVRFAGDQKTALSGESLYWGETVSKSEFYSRMSNLTSVPKKSIPSAVVIHY